MLEARCPHCGEPVELAQYLPTDDQPHGSKEIPIECPSCRGPLKVSLDESVFGDPGSRRQLIATFVDLKPREALNA